VNVPAPVGVLVAVVLVVVGWRAGVLRTRSFLRSDWIRVVIAAGVLVVALPWIAADLGFYFNGVPGLGWLFQTGELRTEPGNPVAHPAVHHGHHHGMDGALLVLAAVLLSRRMATVRRPRLRSLLVAYLALLLTYGIGNVANDAWLEQVVKRGWTDWQIPSVTEPRLTVAWAIIVGAAGTIWGIWTRSSRAAAGKTLPSAAPTSYGRRVD
jgi:hypothetical protein